MQTGSKPTKPWLRVVTQMPEPRTGLTMRERFNNDEVSIQSTLYECAHGKHYEVVVVTKACGHRKVIAHTHSHREHWAQMYEASERLILTRGDSHA